MFSQVNLGQLPPRQHSQEPRSQESAMVRTPISTTLPLVASCLD
jgi:hypothetical protein